MYVKKKHPKVVKELNIYSSEDKKNEKPIDPYSKIVATVLQTLFFFSFSQQVVETFDKNVLNESS